METVFLVQLPSISFELTIMFSNSQELGPNGKVFLIHPPIHRIWSTRWECSGRDVYLCKLSKKSSVWTKALAENLHIFWDKLRFWTCSAWQDLSSTLNCTWISSLQNILEHLQHYALQYLSSMLNHIWISLLPNILKSCALQYVSCMLNWNPDFVIAAKHPEAYEHFITSLPKRSCSWNKKQYRHPVSITHRDQQDAY